MNEPVLPGDGGLGKLDPALTKITETTFFRDASTGLIVRNRTRQLTPAQALRDDMIRGRNESEIAEWCREVIEDMLGVEEMGGNRGVPIDTTIDCPKEYVELGAAAIFSDELERAIKFTPNGKHARFLSIRLRPV